MKYTLNGQLYKEGKFFPLHSANAYKGAQV